MSKRPIASVTPLKDYILQVEFKTGNVVMLDMKPRLSGVRFGAIRDPAVWSKAGTDGLNVLWPGTMELSCDEILEMATDYY